MGSSIIAAATLINNEQVLASYLGTQVLASHLEATAGENVMAAPAAQDYVEILNLYAEYNLCSDAGDAEGYAACFAKKGVLELITAGLTLSGHENFVAFKKKDKAGRPHIFRRHWNGSIHLDTQADGTVKGRCYLLAFNGKPKEIPAIADCGVYEDTLIKEDGAWKFLKRHLVMDATTFVAPMKSAGVA